VPNTLTCHPGWRDLTQAELEREYTPSSRINGNYQPFLEANATRSAAARERALALGSRWHEFRYGTKATQRMDLCLPPSAGTRRSGAGLLVFIHGGYWQELSAAESLFPAAQCTAHGLAFAAIDYTLAPAASVGQIVAECRTALAWLADHASELRIDNDNIVLAGSSAGAQLAAMTCLPVSWPGQEPTCRPRALMLVSGIYELEPLVATSVNAALGLDAATARSLSPALHPLRGFPTTVICWGEIETEAFKVQSQQFAAALRAVGTPCEAFEVPGRNHFDVVLDLAEPQTLLGRHTLSLFGL